jgi:cobalt/nickel transport system permease protein
MDLKNKVPDWLLNDEETVMYPCEIRGARKKADFMEKTINDATNIIRNVIHFEDTALQNGFLQKLDPRIKVISLIMLITTATLIHNIVIIAILYIVSCILAKVSHISLKFYIKRIWFVIPLFTGVMILPSIFNFVKPGDSLISIINFGQQLNLGPFIFPSELCLTKQGVSGAALLILRVGTAVSFAFLFTVTTRWNELLRAFKILFLPQIFVTILEMCYRYIFILINITADMFIARKSRTLDKIDSKTGRHFVSKTMVGLFGKSYTMNEEIYEAMVSRGYKGEQLIINRFKFTMLDFQWILCVLICILLAFGGEIILG